ncbi:TonB-dependent siderophore receptor [Shinella sp. BYT-45]|uniref:TonB-dependent siderophore receptor n=1 Tax=Shinella sp. BYT-45 TaxID=3377377 RepID=UPI00397F073A
MTRQVQIVCGQPRQTLQTMTHLAPPRIGRLAYTFSNPTTVRIISRQTARDAPDAVAADGSIIVVEGQGESAWGPVTGIVATRSAGSSKTDTPLIETPQSVSVISTTEVKERGAQSISEALLGTPGVVTETLGSDVRYDITSVRGFTPNTFLNGLSLPLGYLSGTHGLPQVEPYGLERIEVLRGPSSGLYGQVPPGGLLNLVSKRPTEEAFGEVQLQTGYPGRAQTAFDIGGPVTEDGSLLYRLTGLGRIADTQVDTQDEKRLFIAPSFTWRPTDDTTFTFLSSYLKNDSGTTGTMVSAVGSLYSSPNGRISTSTYLGEKDYDSFKRELGTVGYAFEHRFSDDLIFRQNLQYADSKTDNHAIMTNGYVIGSDRLLNRRAAHIINNGTLFSVDNQLQWNVDTGPLEHKILVGVDYQKFKNEFWYRLGNAPRTIDAYDPNYSGYSPTSWTINNQKSQDVSHTRHSGGSLALDHR